jgi:hypothetical protein
MFTSMTIQEAATIPEWCTYSKDCRETAVWFGTLGDFAPLTFPPVIALCSYHKFDMKRHLSYIGEEDPASYYHEIPFDVYCIYEIMIS